MENFKKIRVVGRGAFGVCWLCERLDQAQGKKVIIKTIQLGPDDEQKIMSEVKLLQKLKHPMIIGYYDSFILPDEKQLAIVMKYAEGDTMEKLIADQNDNQIPLDQALNYFTQIAIALDHMHSKNIVHRDLKTQNILMNKKRTICMLSDFGISKELTTRSVANTVIGTPNYLSPEICEGRVYNQKTDVWSLGCILYELLELKRAFDGENLPAIVMKITRGQYAEIKRHDESEVIQLVDSLLNLNENKRPTVKELLTCPLLLPHTLTIHLDIGRLTMPQNCKQRPNGTSRLGTTPTLRTTQRIQIIRNP
ncbi:unnamed protein product [Auanema sp. JU1783]|nr:unnamed protein product [Auanema sp. JU1783]